MQKDTEKLMMKSEKKDKLINSLISKEYNENKNETKLGEGFDELFCTPLTKALPLARWQGKTSSILKLGLENDYHLWVYFLLEDPEECERLILQVENKTETIFFSHTNQKYYRIANDCLYWSYYTSGPYQRLEGGVWLPVSKEAPTDDDMILIKGKNFRTYKLNNLTGLLERVISEEEKQIGEAVDKVFEILEKIQEDSKNITSSEFYEKMKKVRLQREKEIDASKDEEVSKEVQNIMEEVNKNAEIQSWRDVLKKGESSEIPPIKSNKIVKSFEEVTQLYGIDFEYLREPRVPRVGTYTAENHYNYFPIESMNDVKFIVGIILPEFCLYPKSLLKALKFPKFLFCGNIYHIDKNILYHFGEEAAIGCKEKNFIKIQKGFHNGVFQKLYLIIVKLLPDINNVWNALNPPDFEYNSTRQRVPKGLKGFITFNATLNATCDMNEIYFALMKDPTTILNHSDIIIAKKGHLLKQTLETVFPNIMTDRWWEKVTGFKDIIEQSLGASDYFKEAKFSEDQIESK